MPAQWIADLNFLDGDEAEFVLSLQEAGNDPETTRLSIPRRVWNDMGKPGYVKITVEERVQ